MMNIQLFVCCHKEYMVSNDYSIIKPIQVGAALAEKHFLGYLYDDQGENISKKNRSYCEITAQYWVWKNVIEDYVGFFHYRRYLYPDILTKKPYRFATMPDETTLQKLYFDRFMDIIPQYDIIAPIPEDMHVSVREHYLTASNHRKSDWKLLEAIIQDKYPEYKKALDSYANNTQIFFGNIYIMAWPIFSCYCEWLFSVLTEFDQQADWTGRSEQEMRVDGFLAERLFGIWLSKEGQNLKILYLPRVHFEPDRRKRIMQIAINTVLPPGSKRRAKIKQIRMGK